MKRQCARQSIHSIPLHHHHRISIRLKMLPGTKRCDLRQHIITALCYLLRYPFALLNLIGRPFQGRAWRNPRSIVVIKPCCLGDLVMTTPLLEVIRHAYPDASISYVAGTWSKVIPEHHPAVDTVIDCGTVGIPGRYSFTDYRKLARTLRAHHFDLAFVLDRSPMLTLLPWLSGIPRRVGPDSLGRGFSLTDRVPVSSSPTHLQHQAEVYLDLARAIGLPVDAPRMRFEPTAQERQSVSRPSRLRIALFTGGGSNPGMDLTAKRWPLDRFEDLARKLIYELGAQLLLIGGPGDVPLNQQLQDALGAQGDTVINLTGKTSLGELAAQLEQCALFIGNDSSPMHLAAAVDIPVIAIFGPTSPQEYGPYPLDDPRHIAIWRHPTGQPCFFLGKMQACAHCTCMQSVTGDDVWQAVLQLTPSHEAEMR
ncbi:MAG: lipopolysaccharide heptosyltransferase II [Chloroflexi bacterium]|nr:MAG: lipopolysaccharide heptosyltransferase II [Chloroflexota bacterium]